MSAQDSGVTIHSNKVEEENVKVEAEKAAEKEKAEIIKKSNDNHAEFDFDNHEPLWISKMLVNHTCKFFLILFFFSLVFIMLIGGKFKYSENLQHDYWIKTDKRSKSELLRVEAISVLQASEDLSPLRSQEESMWSFYLMFKDKNDQNILTLENLKLMKEYQDKIKDHALYLDLCYAGASAGDGECSDLAEDSILKFFPSDLDTLSNDDFNEIIANLSTRTDTEDGGYFGLDFTEASPNTPYVRTFYKFGSPIGKNTTLREYDNRDDQFKKQTEVYKDWLEDTVDYLIDKSDSGNIEMKFLGEMVWDYFWQKTMAGDTTLVSFSLLFVYIYMSIHTTSPFLSAIGILGILFAFPISFGIYYYIFGISFFQVLHTLVIFVILGIGADDVFVFVDAFKQIPIEYPQVRNNLLLHVDLTFRRAANAMLVTSCTTMAAFAATIPSRIMPISAFGIFAATLVIVNYSYVITMFPCAIVFWHRYFRNACCCYRQNDQFCCGPCAKNKNNSSSAVTDIELGTVNNDDDQNNNNKIVNNEANKKGMNDYSKMELWFYNKWFSYNL